MDVPVARHQVTIIHNEESQSYQPVLKPENNPLQANSSVTSRAKDKKCIHVHKLKPVYGAPK